MLLVSREREICQLLDHTIPKTRLLLEKTDSCLQYLAAYGEQELPSRLRQQ